MTAPRCQSATLIALVMALTSSVSTVALAQSQDASRTLGNNDSLLIDGRTFNITPGTAKGDVSAQITKLGAREIGAGAIVFRSGDKLYIADSMPISPGALIYNPDAERQRAYGMYVDCGQAASARDPNCLPIATLRDQDNARQQQSQLDYERQRPLGLHDQDYARRQQSQLDYERQRPRGLTDTDIERQRPRGLSDADASHRIYINDPDYSYYRLKKAFEEAWTPVEKK